MMTSFFSATSTADRYGMVTFANERLDAAFSDDAVRQKFFSLAMVKNAFGA
jgi:hypothetical protein